MRRQVRLLDMRVDPDSRITDDTSKTVLFSCSLARRSSISLLRTERAPAYEEQVRSAIIRQLTRGILLGVLVLVLQGTIPENSSQRANTSDGVISFRPTEGRLVGFSYAALRDAPKISFAEQVRNRRIRQGRSGSVERLIANAYLYLIDDKPQQAISMLESAISRNTGKSSLYSDLSAAYLAAASNGEDIAYSLINALAASMKAIHIDSGLLEARFNYALSLERLFLFEQSWRAWQYYLLLDSTSSWAGEARQHLNDLQMLQNPKRLDLSRRLQLTVEARDHIAASSVVKGAIQESRLYLERRLLPEWARMALSGRSLDDAEWLIEQIADSHARESSDPHMRAIVNGIVESRGPQRAELIKGILLYVEGMEFFDSYNIDQAQPRLLKAKHLLGQSGSPLSEWANLYSVACLYHRKRYSRVLTSIEIIKTAAKAAGYMNLLGRALWLEGLVHLEQADAARSLSCFQQAHELFQKTGELTNKGATASLAAHSLTYLGDGAGAWRYRYEALRSMANALGSNRRPVIYGEATRALARTGMYGVAAIFQREALSLELASGEPLAITEALWWLSWVQHKGGETIKALRNVERAKTYCKQILDDEIRSRTSAGLSAIEGAIRRAREPARAAQLLSGALDFYRSRNFSYMLVDTLFERGRVMRDLGLLESSEQDFLAAIREYERQRAQVPGFEGRVMFFDQARDLFDQVLQLRFVRGDFDAALEYLERGRAQALLQSLGGRAPDDLHSFNLTVERLIERLPRDEAVVEYSLQEESIVTFVLLSSGLRAFRLPIRLPNLRRLIRLVSFEARHGRALTRDLAAEQLYDLLVTPIFSICSDCKRIMIVPDKDLHRIPFAFLRDPKTGHHLVEDVDIALVPSVSIMTYLLERRKSAPMSGNLTLLAVANPLFDLTRHPSLPLLRSAELEVHNISVYFPRLRILKGPQATASKFVKELDNYRIVHFAGHSILDGSSLLAGRLVFAPDSLFPSGELRLEDLYDIKLKRPPELIVLSACKTGGGNISLLEGILGLAHPFLAAGVPAVLATQWEIDDEESRLFFDGFYRYLSIYRDPLRALRAVQIDMIRNAAIGYGRTHEGNSWAAFQLIGVSL